MRYFLRIASDLRSNLFYLFLFEAGSNPIPHNFLNILSFAILPETCFISDCELPEMQLYIVDRIVTMISMRATIFNGTPRKDGNTAYLTSFISEKLKSKGATVEEIFLYPMTIKGCCNCGKCQKRKDSWCSIDDDMTSLYKKFIDSDIIIIASPIYMWNFTACTKAFIDRLHALYNHDFSFNAMKGKKIAFATTMGDDEFVASFAINAAVFFCEYFKCVYSGTIAIPFASKEQIARPLYQEKVNDFVTNLTE
jgi:multimeric flavodoxin WrbA